MTEWVSVFREGKVKGDALGSDFPSYARRKPTYPSAPNRTAALDEFQTHIARELHDQVAQPLIGLILDVHSLRTEQASTADLPQELARIEDTVRQVLRQTREMLIDLRGQGDLRFDFVEALRGQIATNLRSMSSAPRLEVSSRWPQQVNGWAAFNLLRIVQEAVLNASRHGKAERIDIFLDITEDEQAVVVVLDDGVGLRDEPSGLGMIGMTERAVVLGGSLNAGSRPAGGSRIEVRVPMERLR